ncbi:lysine--tRNA ligase [Candidatus Woesearchaeota archaeon]|nr:lysine--tRNA ligase [Candidatus Woesearchaeota archaeon]
MENDPLIVQRLEKLRSIREELGVNPYPYSYRQTSSASQILEESNNLEKEEKRESKTVSVAGRIILLRGMGKASFGHLQDASGKIQFYVREDEVKEQYKLFKKLDLGDIIGMEGFVFRTKMGEITIWVKNLSLLTKTLRPLPEKWHGLQDKELRYRKRYLDLIANPEIKKVFVMRSKIITAVREILNAKGFIEVEVPLLQPIYGGANARPFKTHINAWNMDLFLSISPELYLKRLIIGGFEKVYTIGKNFRNEGSDKTHNPEFTMMECYQAYADYNEMMSLTEEIFEYAAKKVLGTTELIYQGQKISLKRPWKKLSMAEAIKHHVGQDVTKMSDKELKQLMTNYNIEYEGDFNKGLAVQLIFEELVEDKLIQPTHITDHPKESTPLCKLHRKNSDLIERFEPFINGWEVGNAYSELNDPILQKDLLKEQVEKGRGGDEESHPMDEDYIEALEHGMPPTGGLGIGIDRMIMLFTDSETIRDVILFPTMKPKEE